MRSASPPLARESITLLATVREVDRRIRRASRVLEGMQARMPALRGTAFESTAQRSIDLVVELREALIAVRQRRRSHYFEALHREVTRTRHIGPF